MRVLIGDKLSNSLTPEQEFNISSVRRSERVEGTILSPDQATGAYLSQVKWVFTGLAGFVLVVSLGLSLLADPRDQAMTFGGALVVNLALILFFILLLRRRRRIWNDRLPARASGLPSVGTTIVVDAAGLSLGDRTIPWPALSIDQVELNEVRGRQRLVVYFIERLWLATASEAIVLDSVMIAKGRLLMGNAWLRLRPL